MKRKNKKNIIDKKPLNSKKKLKKKIEKELKNQSIRNFSTYWKIEKRNWKIVNKLSIKNL